VASEVHRYTYGHHASVLRSHRRRTAENSAGYLLTHLCPGLSLLDIGCGPATITADLAARVAPGRVCAVDISAKAVDLARAKVHARNPSNVSFATADVHALEFPDDAFDVVHAHRAGSSPSATPTAPASSGIRSCRPWTVGAIFTDGRPGSMAAECGPTGFCSRRWPASWWTLRDGHRRRTHRNLLGLAGVGDRS